MINLRMLDRNSISLYLSEILARNKTELITREKIRKVAFEHEPIPAH